MKEKKGKEERPVILRIAMNDVDLGTFSLGVGLLWIAHLYYHKGALSGKHTGTFLFRQHMRIQMLNETAHELCFRHDDRRCHRQW